MAKCAWQFLRESDAPTPAWGITVRGWLQPDVFIKAQWVWEPVASFFQSLHTAVDPFRDIRMAVPWSPVLTTSQHADCLLGGSGKGRRSYPGRHRGYQQCPLLAEQWGGRACQVRNTSSGNCSYCRLAEWVSDLQR